MKSLNAWICDKYSEEEEGTVTEGNHVIVRGTKEDVLALAEFVASVAAHLGEADTCHLHLRDHMPGWTKGRHVDVEVSVEARAPR